MNPLLSIIIVNYNHKYFPRMCVEAVLKSNTDFSYEIIVVDNKSEDESIDYLREADKKGTIRLIESGANLGYGKANNLGVKHAKGEFIVISNPDIFVKQDTMQKMLDHLKKNKKIGILAPRLRYYNGKIQESCRRYMTFLDLVIKRTPLKKIPTFKKRLDHYLMNDFDHNKTQSVDLVTGAYFMMKKAVYDEVKGFDPRYFLFMEDYDLCLKVHKAGYQVVYFPETEAEHYHKRLSGGNILGLLFHRVFWSHLKSSFQYFWKWRGKKPL